MKISLNWLKQYIPLDNMSVADIAHTLTMTGIEVEGIEKSAVIPEGVVAAEIRSRDPHPNAEKLSICQVFDGEKTIQIVCGAPNCDAGKIVPLATLGTELTAPDGSVFVIKEAKLRGESSSGMMCSERELGLSHEHGGLLHLPENTVPGTPVSRLFEADTVFELEVTSNRPDWLSHWGVARDLAAALNLDPVFPEITVPACDKRSDSGLVTVEDTTLCPRYIARVVRGVTVKESPEWLKTRLTAIGLRPINNIVDVTNFVLHELGQPLHAFDYHTLAGQKIIVRHAHENENFVTLDHKAVKLQPRHLVICDTEKALALAGIMGGLNSGVTESTTDILVESAYFLPSNVRATSKELEISSDSAYRFERGADYEMAMIASNRAVQLILETAGGVVNTLPLDVAAGAPERNPFILKFAKINSLLGTSLPGSEMIHILQQLGATIDSVSEAECRVTAPSWRHDLAREADAAEEIIRIHGLEKLPFIPVNAVQGGVLRDDKMYPTQVVRNQLIALGLYECYSYSMVDEKTALTDPTFTREEVITITNPLNQDMACLRPSLFAQMLQNIGRNISRNNTDLRLFEIGRVFCQNKKNFTEERHEIAIGMTGLRMPEMYSDDYRAVIDFADLKGTVEGFFELQKLPLQCRAAIDPRFMPGRCAEIIVRGKTVGFIGEIAAVFTRGMRLRHPLYVGIFQLDLILKNPAGIPLLVTPSTFPPTARDVAFIAQESLTHQEVVRCIQKQNPPNLDAIQLFDIFRDPKTVGEEKKSMAYSLTFRHPERTLTDDEVNQAFEKVRQTLQQTLKVELR